MVCSSIHFNAALSPAIPRMFKVQTQIFRAEIPAYLDLRVVSRSQKTDGMLISGFITNPDIPVGPNKVL